MIGTTLQDVRLELAREEAARSALGTIPRHEVSMATFLMTGFELEDSQCVIHPLVYLITSHDLLDMFCFVKQPRRRV